MGRTLSIVVEETVSNALELVTPSRPAVIVVVPAAMDAASPLEPVVLLMVAVVVSEELHVTVVVISFVELSE